MAISRDPEPPSSRPDNGHASNGLHGADLVAVGDERQLEDLNAQVDHLTAILEAMWTLLSAEVGLTDAQLEERLGMQVDNQEPAPPPGTCRGCGVSVGPDVHLCMFCSAAASKNGA